VPPAAEAVFTNYVNQAGTGVLKLAASGSVFYPSAYDPDAGEVALTVIGARSATIALPAGWTSLATGTVGDLTYRIGYKVLTGTDDWDAAISPGFTYAFPWVSSVGYANCLTWIVAATALTPSATVTTYDTATGGALPSVTAGFNGWAAIRSTDTDTGPSVSASGAYEAPDIVSLGYGKGATYNDLQPATGSLSTSGTSSDIAAWAIEWA
jgi:hypothetical protein